MEADVSERREQARGLTRVAHYLGLGSHDGMNLAKHFVDHAATTHGIKPLVDRMDSAWRNRRRDPRTFEQTRDQALAHIETELQKLGLPYEDIFGTPDFRPVHRPLGCYSPLTHHERSN